MGALKYLPLTRLNEVSLLTYPFERPGADRIGTCIKGRYAHLIIF